MIIVSFNLIDEPWIPCTNLGGNSVELGLRDTLLSAHELREIYDESPLVTASLHRLLLCVLHRIFGPSSPSEWFSLWNKRRWEPEPIISYLDRWHDRFDLFHPDPVKRFYQSPPDERFKPRSIIHLIHSRGDNPTLFNHQTDESTPGLSLSQAARALITAQSFRLGGLLRPDDSAPDSPCARGICFMTQGYSLFETLVLNLVGYPDETIMRWSETDRPTWEMDDPFAANRVVQQEGCTYADPYGYLDYLSWQSCRIWLLPPADDGLVKEVRIGLGQPKLHWSVLDPMKHYRASPKDKNNPSGYRELRFSEGRALWRDSATLLQHKRDRRDHPPACLDWLAKLIEKDYDGVLGEYPKQALVALGMANDQAKVDFYRQERWPLPLAYLQNEMLVTYLSSALKEAEEVYSNLGCALNRLARLLLSPTADQKEGHKPQPEDIRALIGHWGVERRYWGSLEPHFWILVEDLPHRTEAALERWRSTLSNAAWQAFEEAEALVGPAARSLKATTQGRNRLACLLANTLKERSYGSG